MPFDATDPVMTWLLEPAEPTVRYLASRDLLEPRPSPAELGRLKRDSLLRGWPARILAKQQDRTWWATKTTCYWPKMQGTYWQLELLADFGLSKRDERIANAVEHMLRLHLGPDGGFSPWGPSKPSHFCSTGIAARTLVRLGYEKDERVDGAIAWLVGAQRQDGGWDCHRPPKSTLDAWEALAAFAEIPASRRSSEIQKAVDLGAEFYLERRLLHEGAPYPRWWQVHYPWRYWYDVLVGLHTLTALGYAKDPRMADAFRLLESKRRTDGRWTLEGANGNVRFEVPGKPSKMVTFLALRTLRRAGRVP